MQECIMARESGICYSSAALVVNYGAGIAGPVTRKDCYEQTLKKIGELEDLIAGVIVRLRNVHVECSCSQVPLDLITYK
ncbi:5'-methylthioadenosine phosphorylase [compost metagenome]